MASSIENVATILGTTAIILGLYAMGAGGNCAWGALLMLNLNYLRPPKS
jgi:membrane-bound ClpP family serine protease